MENGKSGNKMMMVVIIVLLVVLLGTIAFATITIMSSLSPKATEVVEEPVEQTDKVLKPDDILKFSLTEPIATNILSEDKNVERLARVSITIGVDGTDTKNSAATLQKVTDNEMIIRSICLKVIRNCYYEELKRPDGQNLLESRLLKAIRDEFSDNLIYSVYTFDLLQQ